jgi:hypothetical protein
MPLQFDSGELSEWKRKVGLGKLRVLLIGVNSYESNLASLSFAVKDCKKLREVIEATTLGLHPIIRTLYGDDRGNEADKSVVTVDKVEQGLDHLLTGATTGDTVLFIFSGHGVLDSASQEVYLCLSKTDLNDLRNTGLPVKSILKRLAESGASKQVVILDACHSGAATRSKGGGIANPTENYQFIPGVEEVIEQYVKQNDSSKHFHAFLSCSGNEQSYEDLKDLKHGIFSYYLIQGISGQAADSQGWIHADELWNYVSRKTREYSRKLNVSQTPRHFKNASEEVILGIVEKTSLAVDDLDSSGYGDTFPSDLYGRRWWKELKQNYPLSPTQSAKFRQLAAKGLFLPIEEVERIETEIIQRFEGQLKAYQQRATQCLHGSYPHEADPFIELRREMGLKPEVLKPYEERAKQTFDQHERQYRDVFSAALYERGAIGSDTRQQLQRLQQDCGFAPAVITEFETQEIREFERCKAEYQQLFFAAIHDHRVDQQVLAQEQKRLGLGNGVVNQIKADVTQQLEAKKVEYRGRFAGSIRSATDPDLSPLKALQKNLQLGDALVEIIETEEFQRLERDRKKYREKLKSGLHQQVDFNVEEYHRRQQLEESIDLADVILELLDQSAIAEFEQDCQAYRRNFSQKIRQEDPLRFQTKRELQRLQESLGFLAPDRTVSNPVIEWLQQQEQHQYHQDKQVYLQDYTQALRTQTPIHPADRDRLNVRQQQFELSDQIIAQVISGIEQTFETDQKNYCQEFDWQLRNQCSLEPEFVQQLQQKYNLSDVITQPLNTKLIADFERDQNQYHELLIRELNQKASLTSVARQQLRKLQTELKLGEVVCQAIEAQVIARFDDERGRRNTYGQLFNRIIRQFHILNDFVLEDHDRADLEQYRCDCQLTSEEASEIEAQMLQQYQEDIQQYQTLLKQASYPLADEAIEGLESCRVNLNLSSQLAHNLEQQCLTEKEEQYEQSFLKAVIRQYPIANKEQKQLRQLQQKLGLRDELILPIHQKVQAYVDEINKILEAE